MQVPELIGDEVELVEGDLLIRLHLLHVVAKVEVNSHPKHNTNLYAKRPYLARQLSEDLALAISSS